MPKTRRRVTVLGRVVYDRPTHFFTIPDVIRTLRGIAERDKEPLETIRVLIYAIGVLWMEMIEKKYPTEEEAAKDISGAILDAVIRFALKRILRPVEVFFSMVTVRLMQPMPREEPEEL